jgi:hypothetical protein
LDVAGGAGIDGEIGSLVNPLDLGLQFLGIGDELGLLRLVCIAGANDVAPGQRVAPEKPLFVGWLVGL